jgi:hypothetical protein
MRLKIFLDIQSYECLIEHISREAPGRVAINAAVLLGNTRVVDCDDTKLAIFWLARGTIVPVPFAGLSKQCSSLG